jgi:hypothetical protein
MHLHASCSAQGGRSCISMGSGTQYVSSPLCYTCEPDCDCLVAHQRQIIIRLQQNSGGMSLHACIRT